MRSVDINNMKVADLKRELKLRSLPTSGNKTELQERLQVAIETEPILDDSAISGEDLLYEDGVLSDEDDPKILCTEENELLESPVAAATHLTNSKNEKIDNTNLSHTALRSPTTVPKKIVLKRKSSTTSLSNNEAKILKSSTGENKEATSANLLKRSERQPVTADCNDKKLEPKDTKAISDLSMQERLELRAKKFGLNTNLKSSEDNKTSSSTGMSHDKQLDILKKRAERFGCVTSKNLAKVDAEERLLKRKERFGEISTNIDRLPSGTNYWADKAAKRLERFKTSPAIPNITTIN